MLGDRDWCVDKTKAGLSIDDLVVIDDTGKTWSVEVKARKLIDVEKWRVQARANAKKRDLPWMLAMRIHGVKAWLVEFHEGRNVWHKVWTERKEG
jgi:predicted RecB family endonuclease